MASAQGQRRHLGAYISSLGDSPEDPVRGGWSGGRFQGLEQHLIALTPMVHALAESHLTYPLRAADLDAISEVGIPTVTSEEYCSAIEEQAPRQRQLAALLVDEGWSPEACERRRQKIRAGAEPPDL